MISEKKYRVTATNERLAQQYLSEVIKTGDIITGKKRANIVSFILCDFEYIIRIEGLELTD